jgi:hypothetical protein
MTTLTPAPEYPVGITVAPQLRDRNRLTTAFRIILYIPHALLVGGPIGWRDGVLGAVAAVCSVIAWFAILFTGKHPKGLYDLSTFYLRWKMRAISYVALFRDEYPPFGDAEYPAQLELEPAGEQRDRLSVGLRIIYAIPHLILLVFLGIAWGVTSIIAWFAILFTGAYPEGLYNFGLGVFRWQIRVEAYLLLLRDEYPPFTLSA